MTIQDDKRPVGRPTFLKEGVRVNVFIDKKTDIILRKVNPNRSKAIREVVGTYEKDHLDLDSNEA